MRKWGILITAIYALTLAFFVLPMVLVFIGEPFPGPLKVISSLSPDQWSSGGGAWWIFIVILTVGQALLFFVSVDTSYRKLRPRRSIALSVAAIAIAVGLLTTVAVLAVLVAYVGEDDPTLNSSIVGILIPIGSWLLWGIVFYLYRNQIWTRLDKVVNWLIAGSVLELLIVVPCHVIVRQRGDCSAPIATGFGIATGIAVMLMAFGPSVVFLYQRRIRRYQADETQSTPKSSS